LVHFFFVKIEFIKKKKSLFSISFEDKIIFNEKDNENFNLLLENLLNPHIYITLIKKLKLMKIIIKI
jgi:hypothetical protein